LTFSKQLTMFHPEMIAASVLGRKTRMKIILELVSPRAATDNLKAKPDRLIHMETGEKDKALVYPMIIPHTRNKSPEVLPRRKKVLQRVLMRIKVLDIRRITLGSISLQSAEEDGFSEIEQCQMFSVLEVARMQWWRSEWYLPRFDSERYEREGIYYMKNYVQSAHMIPLLDIKFEVEKAFPYALHIVDQEVKKWANLRSQTAQ